MRNDYQGYVVHDALSERYTDKLNGRYSVQTFYASGQGGNEARADGKGGLLPRGYYGKHEVRGGEYGLFRRIGPFNTRNQAERAAIRSLVHYMNHK